MPKTPPSDEKVLEHLDAVLAQDVLTDAYSEEDVDAAIRAAGGDPDAIGREGKDLGAQLLERNRLAWQEEARRRLLSARSAISPAADRPRLPKSEMLRQIDLARRDPRLSAPVVAAFRKRKPEEANEDELHELLAEIEMLRQLASESSDDPEGE
ncbi:MAG: hypothetical protein PHU25_15355 [Deltaproteobacteria bacterium]|nr:hypothetical protein [Deltaproteobacteria bacterium]